jgi:hypothetical protein
MTARHSDAKAVWGSFCRRFGVAERSIPLFQADVHGVVATRLIGRGDNRRPVLMRSP